MATATSNPRLTKAFSDSLPRYFYNHFPDRLGPAQGERLVRGELALEIVQQGGRYYRYRDLPRNAQMALAWYMSVDGEAWPLPDRWQHGVEDFLRTQLSSCLKGYVKEFGSKVFGYVQLRREFVDEQMYLALRRADPYRAPVAAEPGQSRYLASVGADAANRLPRHSYCNWPLILAGGSVGLTEFIEDGYNRAINYLLKRKKLIPALWYPEKPT